MHGTTAKVTRRPNCQLCEPAQVPATIDGKTTFGPWAYMCDGCHEANGMGLGIGLGQRLVVAGEPLACDHIKYDGSTYCSHPSCPNNARNFVGGQ